MPMRRCTRCQTMLLPSAVVCPACLSREAEPLELPAQGRLVTWTTIRRAPAGYPVAAPYDVVVVDLGPGLRVTGRLAPDSAPPHMDARVTRLADDGPCPVFAVAAG